MYSNAELSDIVCGYSLSREILWNGILTVWQYSPILVRQVGIQNLSGWLQLEHYEGENAQLFVLARRLLIVATVRKDNNNDKDTKAD